MGLVTKEVLHYDLYLGTEHVVFLYVVFGILEGLQVNLRDKILDI